MQYPGMSGGTEESHKHPVTTISALLDIPASNPLPNMSQNCYLFSDDDKFVVCLLIVSSSGKCITERYNNW